MNINSTEEERYNEIKDRILEIVSWNPENEIKYSDGNESFAHALRRHAKELDLFGVMVQMDGLKETAVFTRKTLGESINLTLKRMGDLKYLDKLLTNLVPVLKNAILIEKETFRHKNMNKAKNIEYVAQFAGAFHDGVYVYPTKIAATKIIEGADPSTLKLTITLNRISIRSMIKGSPDAELHPVLTGEGPFDWGSTLKIRLSDFVKYFNSKDSILLKNFPDQMLTEFQQGLKESVRENDRIKEENVLHNMSVSEYQDPITEYEPVSDDLFFEDEEER